MTPADLPVPSGSPSRRLVWMRLAPALAITLGVLPYAWGRTLILTQVYGRPEPLYCGLFLGGLLAVVALTHGAGVAGGPRRLREWVQPVWALLNVGLIGFVAGDAMPKPVVAVMFVAASMWVPWLGWSLYRALPAKRAALEGGACLVGLMASLGLMKVSGLTGDAKVDFAWRWTSKAHEASRSLMAAAPLEGFEPTPGDFSEFFGAGRTGEATLASDRASDWTTPPREVWRAPCGLGWSGFAIRGDYAVTHEQLGPDETVTCRRISSGELVWSSPAAEQFQSVMGGDGPRATPVIAEDGRVYVVGATGLLRCLDGYTGREEWRVNILEDNGGGRLTHGVCGSPLVDGDRVIVAPTGRRDVCLAAYDRLTGQRLWTGGGTGASYSSPLIADVCGRRQILLHGGPELVGCDAATGQRLWGFAWSNGFDNNCSQPIILDGPAGRILATTGYGTGAVLLTVRVEGDAWNVAQEWTSRDMKTKFTSAHRCGEFVYGLDDGILACIDLASGKRRWKGGRYGHGQVLKVGERLLVLCDNGDLALVDPQPEKFVELARLPAISGKTWNYPAVSATWILVRNAEEAACFEWPKAARP